MGKTTTNVSRIELADKHNVSLTFFNNKCYFHIRHSFNHKSVSLTYADMKSLVQQFPEMKKRMKVVRKQTQEEEKKKSKKRVDDSPPPPPDTNDEEDEEDNDDEEDDDEMM